MVSELYLKKKNPVLNWAYSMLSQMYIAYSQSADNDKKSAESQWII